MATTARIITTPAKAPGLNQVARAYGGGGLGDSWATISYLGRLAKHRTVSVSRYSITGTNIHHMLSEIIKLLDLQNKVNISDKHGQPMPFTIWHKPYLPTTIQWKPGKYKQICYQLDGISNAHVKNPPNKDIKILKSFVDGFEFVRLGRPRSITESVEIMAKSDLFFGVDSGYSHVCHSVGTPCFIIQYKNGVNRWHGGKHFTTCLGTKKLVKRVRGYLVKQGYSV